MEQAVDPAKARGPRAISRVLDLLTLLSDESDGMSLAELSNAMSVPKSTFLDTLRGLADLNYLTHEDGRYRLGSAAYQFASQIIVNWSAPEMIRAEVKALARTTSESVGFAIADWEIGQAIYMEAVNSRQPVHYAMRAGLRAPLYASAAGRVLLAFASPKQIDGYLENAKLRRLTDKTRIDPAAIHENLKDIRKEGYCASFGELLNDTAAIAVPVLGPYGAPLGAMMIAAPLDRMRKNYQYLLDAIILAGKRASAC